VKHLNCRRVDIAAYMNLKVVGRQAKENANIIFGTSEVYSSFSFMSHGLHFDLLSCSK